MTAQPMSTGTVGIVLVSHSADLAAGAAHLAAQVCGGTVTIVAAGGTDDGDLGTSAAKVARGIAEAEHGAGVVVLPDLGSAVLTVRAVLEDYGEAGRHSSRFTRARRAISRSLGLPIGTGFVLTSPSRKNATPRWERYYIPQTAEIPIDRSRPIPRPFSMRPVP